MQGFHMCPDIDWWPVHCLSVRSEITPPHYELNIFAYFIFLVEVSMFEHQGHGGQKTLVHGTPNGIFSTGIDSIDSAAAPLNPARGHLGAAPADSKPSARRGPAGSSLCGCHGNRCVSYRISNFNSLSGLMGKLDRIKYELHRSPFHAPGVTRQTIYSTVDSTQKWPERDIVVSINVSTLMTYSWGFL